MKLNLEHKPVTNLDKEYDGKPHPAIPTVLVLPLQSSLALGFGLIIAKKERVPLDYAGFTSNCRASKYHVAFI